MNAPLHREVLLRAAAASDDAQALLPLAAPGVQRWVWDGRYGQILIEVVGGQVRVNGALVEPADAPAAPPPVSGLKTPR
jgi:hypothetical protein